MSDSCGYAVPRMELVEERETLDPVWRTRDDERIAAYHAEKNATSLDGLPGLSDRRNPGGARGSGRARRAPVRSAHRSGGAPPAGTRVIICREGEERA